MLGLRSLFLLLLCLSLPTQAAELVMVLNDKSGPYAEFASTLEQRIRNTSWRALKVYEKALPDSVPAETDLIVTAGGDALRETLARQPSQPVLATLLTRAHYERIVRDSPRPKRGIALIHLDQPAARQARFIKLLLAEKRQVGVLLSDDTLSDEATLNQAMITQGLSLRSERVGSTQNPVSVMESLLSRVDVLLALADSNIYHRDSIRPLLMTAYRYQRPLVGFSPALVKAGALAALYSTPTQIADQAADWLAGGPAPALPTGPQAPNRFTIALNASVAQALNLRLPDEGSLQRQLLDREGR